jgi:hypothetical protein
LAGDFFGHQAFVLAVRNDSFRRLPIVVQ